MSPRLKAFLIHLLGSALVTSTVLVLVLLVWYPGPYLWVRDTPKIVAMLVAVDVILGPLMTLIVFNHTKSRRELRLDIALIVVVQLAALSYGVHSTYIGRPLYTAFYFDQFMVSTAEELELDKLPEELKSSPFTGPQLVAVRPPKDDAERNELWRDYQQGKAASPFQRTDRYEPIAAHSENVFAKGRTPEAFKAWDPAKSKNIDTFLAGCGEPLDQLLIYEASYLGGRLLVLNRQSGKLVGFIDY